jgi:hypothetical protein
MRWKTLLLVNRMQMAGERKSSVQIAAVIWVMFLQVKDRQKRIPGIALILYL